MSRSLWRCRNPQCPVPHGAVLGRVTMEGGLVLAPSVAIYSVYLDAGKVVITCPGCGVVRVFRGSFVHSAQRNAST